MDVNHLPVLLKLITDYGIATLGIIAIATFLTWLIKYILRQNEIREKRLSDLLTNDMQHLVQSINTLTTNLSNFSNNVHEAQKYSREEHKQMIECLIKLNGKSEQ